MKYGIVDIGSNTVRLNLYLITDLNNIVSLLNKKTVAGLSTYIEDNQMTKKGADKLIRILKNYIEICNHFEIDKLHMFATAALRNVKNSDEIVGYVSNAIGFDIDLVSGEEEAELGYFGVKEDYRIKDGYIVDIGGGSVEMTVIEDQKVIYSTSIRDGSLSLFRKFCTDIIPNPREAKDIKRKFRSYLEDEDIPVFDDEIPIYGIGGTIRACGNICMEAFDQTSNALLYSSTVNKLAKCLIKKDENILKTVLQVVPERVHTITPGCIILREIIKYTNSPVIYISNKGARDGYLMRSLIYDRKEIPIR